MYTRSFFQDDEKINIPKNYDGNAFREEDKEDGASEAEIPTGVFSPPLFRAHDNECVNGKKEEAKRDTGRGFPPLFVKKLLPEGLFEGIDILKGGRLEFGKEELLIIGIALFLIFSEGKDLECALMLFLLLFIK